MSLLCSLTLLLTCSLTAFLFRWSKQSSGIVSASLQATPLFTQPEPLCAEQDCSPGSQFITGRAQLLPDPYFSFKTALAAPRGWSVQLHSLCRAMLVAQGRRTGTDWFRKPGSAARHCSSLSRCKAALNWTNFLILTYLALLSARVRAVPHCSSVSWVGTFWMFWSDWTPHPFFSRQGKQAKALNWAAHRLLREAVQ